MLDNKFVSIDNIYHRQIYNYTKKINMCENSKSINLFHFGF